MQLIDQLQDALRGEEDLYLDKVEESKSQDEIEREQLQNLNRRDLMPPIQVQNNKSSAGRQNSGRGAGNSHFSPGKDDELHMQLADCEDKIEDLNTILRSKDEEIQKVREYFQTYEEENKSLQA